MVVVDPTTRASDRARRVLKLGEEEIAAGTTSAARLVQRAGSILEEELSAGIAALDRLQGQYVDVERLRDPETHELLNRFRTDAHQVVDLLIDGIGASIDVAGRIADRNISIGLPLAGPAGRAATTTANGGAAGQIPMLKVADPVARGAEAEVSMAVTNAAEETTEEFSLSASDLVSEQGDRIPAGNVVFDPATLTIAGATSERIVIKVQVPEDIAPGTYAGLVQATKLGHVRTVLTIEVE